MCMEWVTRERAGQVFKLARQTGAMPYDIPGVELTHVGELCSFDAFLKKYHLEDPGLSQRSTIVRGADTSRLDLAPQSAGHYAISLGLSTTLTNDHEMLRDGVVMYDVLYACAQSYWTRHTSGRPPVTHWLHGFTL